MNDVVSNARWFTNGKVKRYHTSNLLNGGNPVAGANHDALQHGAVREIYGIDTA